MKVIENKRYRDFSYDGDINMHGFKSQVNLFDEAVVRIGQNMYEGQITMVDFRGIDMITPWGIQFVKWINVKEIRKGDDGYEHSNS